MKEDLLLFYKKKFYVIEDYSVQQDYFSNNSICILILSSFTFCGPSRTLWVFIIKDVIICVG